MASVATVNVGKLTESGTDEAKSGVSMADMIARIVTEQVAKATAGVGVETPKASAVKVKSVKVSVKAGKGKVVEAVEREKFNAREYFSLGPSIAETADHTAYVAESANETYGNNPIAFIGVQRKAIMLSEAKARVMLALLTAYFAA